MPLGIFGLGADRVWVMVASGGAALGKDGEDLGTKRTVEAGAMIFDVILLFCYLGKGVTSFLFVD